jgi:hypothetical protein
MIKEKYMQTNELIQKIAYLESMNDQLMAELEYIDELARKIGFEKGLETLKLAAVELYEEQQENISNETDEDEGI